MVQFDNRQWQAKLKIVYYGPAVGGKTTCLQAIHRATDPERRTKLYSLNTASDRTLFFDLMSLKLGRIRGYELLIQLFTVPGQVQYQATRKAVLGGADGVVFVADSQVDRVKDNVESLRDLVANLRSHGMDPETIPLVYQYNKQDLDPLIPNEDLEMMLNPRKRPAFPTVATTGQGVLEGFAEICHTTVMSVAAWELHRTLRPSSDFPIRFVEVSVPSWENRIARRPRMRSSSTGHARPRNQGRKRRP